MQVPIDILVYFNTDDVGAPGTLMFVCLSVSTCLGLVHSCVKLIINMFMSVRVRVLKQQRKKF